MQQHPASDTTRSLLPFWVAVVGSSCMLSACPFFGIGKFSLQPSGLYCNGDFTDGATFGIVFSVVTFSVVMASCIF